MANRSDRESPAGRQADQLRTGAMSTLAVDMPGLTARTCVRVRKYVCGLIGDVFEWHGQTRLTVLARMLSVADEDTLKLCLGVPPGSIESLG